MSQADIDVFVQSARTECVMTAVVTKGIPVNGRHSCSGCTALHIALSLHHRELVVELLMAGANPNVKDGYGVTSVWWAAYDGNADILQLMIDGGGSVNEVTNYGQTPLIALVKNNFGDAATRLQVLLACPELDLDATYHGKPAEEWAVRGGRLELALMIVEERARRERWSALRAAWVAGTTPPPTIL
jgi:hypothetical protein